MSAEFDETAYLLADPANRVRLLEAIDNVRRQRNLVGIPLGSMGFQGVFAIPSGDLNEDLEAARRALAESAAR
ncbi:MULTISPECIES: hypothetical protein [unclassified Thiocapsa]|uniref:hypothetical protein n=1 Tax=unclassified Thiocapsa TaxID=2641286 RepID=UPI0035AE383F